MAYGWSPQVSDDELLTKLLELNLSRAGAEGLGLEIVGDSLLDADADIDE